MFRKNEKNLLDYEIDPAYTTDALGGHPFKTILTYADGTIEQVPYQPFIIGEIERSYH